MKAIWSDDLKTVTVTRRVGFLWLRKEEATFMYSKNAYGEPTFSTQDDQFRAVGWFKGWLLETLSAAMETSYCASVWKGKK